MKTPEEIKKGLECCGTGDLGNHNECPYGITNQKCMQTMLHDALALIQQLEAQEPKWISVEERLPDAKTAVLVYGQRYVFNGKQIETFPMEHVAYTRGKDEGWFSWDSSDGISVTHWMPLPEPPKEEER